MEALGIVDADELGPGAFPAAGVEGHDFKVSVPLQILDGLLHRPCPEVRGFADGADLDAGMAVHTAEQLDGAEDQYVPDMQPEIHEDHGADFAKPIQEDALRLEFLFAFLHQYLCGAGVLTGKFLWGVAVKPDGEPVLVTFRFFLLQHVEASLNSCHRFLIDFLLIVSMY